MMKQELNLIEFSDLYRRTPVEQRQLADKRIVELTRHFVAATTHYQPSYDLDYWVNKEPLEKIKTIVKELSSVLNGVAHEIVLPLSAQSPFALALEKEILPGTPFKFQSAQYNTDYSDMPLDADVRTALDEGYRGMFDVLDTLKYKWDRQMKERGQLSLAL